MNEKLQEATNEWLNLEGEKAEKFYEEQLMELIEEDFIKRNHEKIEKDVKYFVVTVGTSFEPIVLNLKLFKPQKILFLYTQKAEETLGRIVSYCGLRPEMYEKSQVDEMNPLDIYREIKKYYLKWDRPKKMHIDISGGMKTMSGASAMAGAMIDVPLVYVGNNDYLASRRKPRPGSEILFYIENPLKVFGDLEIEKALLLFEKFNYTGAKDKLAELKDRIPDLDIRQQMNFVYLLAKAYEAWDALDFVPAYEAMVSLNKELERDRKMYPAFLLMDCRERLGRQEKILERLQNIPKMIKERENFEVLKTKDLIMALMFTMYQNGITRERQGKYDMATLLFYRLLEMIEQRRLASHYNLYASKADYEKIAYDFENMPEAENCPEAERVDLLREKVYEIRRQLFKKNENSNLPEKVSLLEGFILLYALGDPIVTAAKAPGINQLKRIESKVKLRNNSIFAHGLGPVGDKAYFDFKNLVTEMFTHFCQIEDVEQAEYEKDIEWINPMKTKYYTFGIEGE